MEQLQKDFQNVVQRYLHLFFNIYFGCPAESILHYWVGDDIGGVLCVNDGLFYNFNDIRLCIDRDVAPNVLFDWYDYCLELGMINSEIPIPTLESWIMVCPVKSEEEIQRLRELKENVEKAQEELRKAIEESKL